MNWTIQDMGTNSLTWGYGGRVHHGQFGGWWFHNPGQGAKDGDQIVVDGGEEIVGYGKCSILGARVRL